MRLAELMSQFKIPTTFYWPVNWQKYGVNRGRDYLTNSEADAIAREFEIGSHGVNHELLTKVSKDVVDAEIKGSRIALQERFRKPITKFCYPRGYYDDKIRAVVKQAGYEMARTVRVGWIDDVYKDPFQTHTTVHVGYDREEYDGDKWLDFAKKKLQWAIQMSTENPDRDYHYHFWGHSYELTKYNAWAGLRELLDDLPR